MSSPRVIRSPRSPRSPRYRKPEMSKTPDQALCESESSSPSSTLGSLSTAGISPSPSQSHNLPSLRSVLGDILNPTLGYPTVDEFNMLQEEYLSTLSWMRREKALIDSKTYLDIVVVLRERNCTDIGSAQFRFWARKMFQLGLPDEGTHFSRVVLHEGKRVAIREDMYIIICEAHGECGHGGRDVTLKKVRETWRFVPREIITRFVKACPTCTEKKAQKGISPPTKSTKVKYQSNGDDDYASDSEDSSYAEPGTTPRASRKLPATVPTFEGQEPNGKLLPSVPRLLISPVSEYPPGSFSFSENTIFPQQSNSSPSSGSSTPFSTCFSIDSASSGATSPSGSDLDVPLGSPTMELLTNFKPAPLRHLTQGRSLLLRPGPFAMGRRPSADDLRQIVSVSKRFQRPIARARSMDVVRSITKDDLPLDPALALYPAPPAPARLASTIVPTPKSSLSGSQLKCPPHPVRRPQPINTQAADGRFLVHSKPSPGSEASTSHSLIPSPGKVSVDDQGIELSEKRELNKRPSLSLSKTTTTPTREGAHSDPLPPTPSSAASIWSQDSAPNSALFWDASARAYADSVEVLTPDKQSQFTRLLMSPSTNLQLLSLQELSEKHERKVTRDSPVLYIDRRDGRRDIKKSGDRGVVVDGGVDMGEVESGFEVAENREVRDPFLSP